MSMRKLPLVLLALAALLPTAQADIVLLGGAVIIHEPNDPGVSVNAGPGASLRAMNPNCYPGLACVLLAGHVAGTPTYVLAGGGPSNCYPQPSDCAVVLVAHGSDYLLVSVGRFADVAYVCAGVTSQNCVNAAASPSVGPGGAVVCAGATTSGSFTTVPAKSCEGLLVSTSPPCVRRASDGFAIVCQTTPEQALLP